MKILTLILPLPLAVRLLLAAPPAGHDPPAGRDYDTGILIEGNALACFIPNEGRFAYDVSNLRGRSDGLYYPNNWPFDDRTVIYDAGLWLAGIREDGDTLVTVAEYSTEYAPGGWGSNPAGSQWHVYSVTQDPATWSDWPADQGAPLSADGQHPWIADLPEATHMLFTVFNDGNPAIHYNDAGSTEPLGVEVRLTSWCSAEPGDEREIWLRWEMLNQGGHDFSQFIAAVWMDPDLGGAGDDLVGCDPQRSLAYCYNATNADSRYGDTPPALGLVLGAGLYEPSPGDSAWHGNAWHPDERNLPATSFTFYINGLDPHHHWESFYTMAGLTMDGAPRPAGPFDFTGDPVTGTGLLDTNPADKRMMLACGPVAFAPGQRQELNAAIAVGQGLDRLSSLTDLRQTAPWPLDAEYMPFTADPLHFIHVETGQIGTQSLVLHNGNLGTWEVDSIAVSHPSFQWLTSLPFTLPGDAVSEHPLSFTATSPEMQTGTLQLFSYGRLILEAYLSANGPWLSLDPVGDLGILPPQGYHGDLTISNIGTTQAMLESFHPGDGIEVSWENGLDPIPPGASIACPISISSQTSGEHESTLGILGNMARFQFFDYAWNQPEVQIWRVDYLTADGGPSPLAGCNFGGAFFGGGVDVGHSFFGSTLPMLQAAPELYHDITLQFSEDEDDWSAAATYLRPGYAFNGIGHFPGQAWHFQEGHAPRRLNVSFVENEADLPDGVWNPRDDALGGREYLFIMGSDYNGGVDYDDDANWAPGADVLWACWLRRVGETGPAEGDLMRFTMEIGSEVANPVASPQPRALSITGLQPNPFNPVTTLGFHLERPVASLRLELFNLLGQRVRMLELGGLASGDHRRVIRGDDLASGLYLLRLSTPLEQEMRRILLLK
jgi:hypothetical protein